MYSEEVMQCTLYTHDCTEYRLYTQADIIHGQNSCYLQVEPRLCGLEEDSFTLPYTRVARPLS